MAVSLGKRIVSLRRRASRGGALAVFAAISAVISLLLPASPAAADLPSPGQSGPPPVINMSAQDYQYLPALQAFEDNAVSEVLATHNLPPSDAAAVLGWGRDDVRAQEWVDLSKIINEPASSRSANDQTVYQWFQSVYVKQQVAEAQDAINEYLKWSGGQSLTDPPVNFGAGNTGYCNYSPPGGSNGPFAGTYTGNQDQTCFTPCTSVLGCTPPYPTIQQFQAWGAYDAIAQETGSSDFANSSQGTIGAVAIGASLLSAGVTTALSAAYGGAGLSSAFVSELFPFLARVGWQSAASIAELGLSAGADATQTAAIAGAATAGAVAFVVGIAIFFIVSTVFAILQLVQNADIPSELQSALSQAQQGTSPDLASVLGDSSSAAGLYATFIAQTMPDVDYTCSTASTDPCADAPAPPAASGSDPLFLVSTTQGGVTTTTPESSIYTVDQRNPDFISTRLSGNGWFVSTRYNGADPANLNSPAGTPGATVEGLQFYYTDWQGRHWVAERIEDSSGNPEFAVAPMDSSTGDPCATSTSNGACVTNTLDIATPNGTDEAVTVVPASAVAPSLAANVPPIVTTGQQTSYSVTGTDPNNLPLTYSWTFYCPGSSPGIGVACFGGEFGSATSTLTGATVSMALPAPGSYEVYVTAKDSSGYSATKILTVNSVSDSTTTVTSSVASPSVYGQAVTFTATVTPQNCQCWRSGIPLAPDGAVQFYVDGVARGEPVPVSPSAGFNTAGNVYATASLPIGDLGPGSHAITVRYLPSGARADSFGTFFGGDLEPGYYGSTGSTTLQVNQAATTTSVSSSVAAPVYGQPVTFTATVAASAPGTGTPAGTVQFYVDGTALGKPVALDSKGQATSPAVSSLSVTPPFGLGHQIGVTYSGDLNHQGSQGTYDLLNGLHVVQAQSSTSVAALPDPSIQGGTATFTATVAANAPSTGIPTGTVVFKDGSATLGTGTLSTANGVTTATFSTSALAVGAHSITAQYQGDGNFSASTSAAVTENVDTSLSGYPKLSDGAYNLSNANLSGSYLAGLSLAGASLYDSNFKNVNFTNTGLGGANMSNSNFTGANFTRANLTGANLSGANLMGAAGLNSATLTNVTWYNTECPDGTLSNRDGGTCIGHL